MEKRQHIVLFPYLAQGHIIPFLSLARLVHRRFPGRFMVTLVSTPLTVRNLRRTVSPEMGIRFKELPFCSSDHGLPPDCENTDGVSRLHILRLYHASESLRTPFERLIRDAQNWNGRAPFCIVADVLAGWTVEVARELAIFHAIFTTCGAYGTATYFSLWLNLPHAGNDDEEFQVPGFPDGFRLRRSQMSSYMKAADGEDGWSLFFRRQISFSLHTDALLCNTAEELEITGMGLLRKFTGLPVWPVGPLVAMEDEVSMQGNGRREPSIAPENCVEWLGLQTRASVLYVSFGSQNTLSMSQTMALAEGLATSGIRFIWVIRPPICFNLEKGSDDEWLPAGFWDLIRERNQGLLVRDWAPQMDILSHPSIGAFLSHCGWNSTLESLSRGIPIIGWPLAADQFYNSKMMQEELGVCVELARGLEEEVAATEIERVIMRVIGGHEGAEMRRKAADLAKTMRAAMTKEGAGIGSSLAAFDEFIRAAEEGGGAGGPTLKEICRA